MKTAGRVLLLGWMLLFLGVGLIFALPKLASGVLHPLATYFQVIPMVLMVATAGYLLVRVYRMGIAKK